jgi:Caspase domain
MFTALQVLFPPFENITTMITTIVVLLMLLASLLYPRVLYLLTVAYIFCDGVYTFCEYLFPSYTCAWIFTNKCITCIRFLATNAIAFTAIHLNESRNGYFHVVYILWILPVYIHTFLLAGGMVLATDECEANDTSENNSHATDDTSENNSHATDDTSENNSHATDDTSIPSVGFDRVATTLYQDIVRYIQSRIFHYNPLPGRNDVTMDNNHPEIILIVAIGYAKLTSQTTLRPLHGTSNDIKEVMKKMTTPNVTFIVLTDHEQIIQDFHGNNGWSHVLSGKSSKHYYGFPTRNTYKHVHENLLRKTKCNNIITHFAGHGASVMDKGGIYLLQECLTKYDHVKEAELTNIHTTFVATRTSKERLRWTFVSDSCHAHASVPLLVGYKISKEKVGNVSKVVVINQHMGSGPCPFDPTQVVMVSLAAAGPLELTSESMKNGRWGGEFTRVVYHCPENQCTRDSMSLVQLAARFDIRGDNVRGMLPEFVHMMDMNECMDREKVMKNNRQIAASVYWGSNIDVHASQKFVNIDYDECQIEDVVRHRRGR